ncbi:sushi, von Willebrand factor type A, EGF and pentraxin domain-containing protein 1 [Elysia marginata]|uniref:Sushi, von Willebrand factor type A, EGF and pentraxin domain-containing protein 1 n=1 Tax=Elysia marginata TaxID=1093978 RepID=A0AAV4HJR9_9GAST|nr:sushi, von Willebrand factor type A, EGF and pentraxin domain-containing protein 1 [Elysia marginata]
MRPSITILVMALVLTYRLHQGYSASLIDTFTVWNGLDIADHRAIIEPSSYVNQQAKNLFQCMRLCWLFRACTVITFSRNRHWCGLFTEEYTRVSRHELGNLRLISDNDSIVVGMRKAVFSKSKVKSTMRNRGCDGRPCKMTELCVPVRSNYEYLCLPLATAYCPNNPPTVANCESHPDGVISVMYTCAPHYHQTGSTFISKCDRIRKRWSPVDIVCNLVDCGAPPSVDGTTSNPLSTLYGEEMVYTCLDGGVSPSESMRVTCQANSQWSDPPEACVFVSCGPPPIGHPNTTPRVLKRPINDTFPGTSVVQLAVAVGGIVQFTCKPGYISPAGTSYTSECQADGTWSPTSQVLCAPRDCGNPPFLSNSYRQGSPFPADSQGTTATPESTTAPLSTTFESVVYYSCFPGYSFGSSACPTRGTHYPLLTLVCNVNGTWDVAPGSSSSLDYSAGCLPIDCGVN